jgi:hypothetical protein
VSVLSWARQETISGEGVAHTRFHAGRVKWPGLTNNAGWKHRPISHSRPRDERDFYLVVGT